MFTIDLILKSTPMPLSVQRKVQEDAEAVYAQVQAAMKTGHPELLELTCEQQPDKKVCVVTKELSAVQVSQKSGSSAPGKQPGFFSAAVADANA
jgi:hypothetical protein